MQGTTTKAPYRDDIFARILFEEARAWTRASFFLHVLADQTTVEFLDGTVAKVPPDTDLLFVDLTPTKPLPHLCVALFVSNTRIESKTLVRNRPVEAHQPGWSRTEGLQHGLNRLRMNEALLLTAVGRNPALAATLFKPDFSAISQVSGIPESTLRGIFDGSNSPQKQELLKLLGVLPEEELPELWRL